MLCTRISTKNQITSNWTGPDCLVSLDRWFLTNRRRKNNEIGCPESVHYILSFIQRYKAVKNEKPWMIRHGFAAIADFERSILNPRRVWRACWPSVFVVDNFQIDLPSTKHVYWSHLYWPSGSPRYDNDYLFRVFSSGQRFNLPCVHVLGAFAYNMQSHLITVRLLAQECSPISPNV